MAFFTILTTIGQAKIANALALGQQIQLTHMALGDGNGNPTTPNQGQTALVREVYREQLNQLSIDSANPNYVIAELVVPSTVGGWTVREVGLYDTNGDMIAVGNFPNTYKPTLDEGASRDLVVRIIIEVSNASVVQLKIDPTVVLASRSWVETNFLRRSKVVGGTTNQILAKKSNTDEDFTWVDPTAAVSVIVDVKPERQTLAAAQTIVNLASIAASGISVYVEGARLIETVDFNVTGPAQITLTGSHPAGSVIHCYQNEALDAFANATETIRGLVHLATPAEAAGGTNSTDVITPATLKSVIDAVAATLTPPGAVQAFASLAPPTGWLRCNGAAVSRATFNALFTAIGTTFGVGDGSTTFNLPDLRGEFVRGLDDGRGVDAGRLVGTAQSSQNLAHFHSPLIASGTGGLAGLIGTSDPDRYGASWEYFPSGGSNYISTEGGTEARPRNVALLYCIKA